MRRVGLLALTIVLLFISAGLGLLAANQVYEASRLLAAVAVPMNPMDATGWQRAVVLLPRLMLLVLLFAWLGAVMVWMHRYTQRAAEPRRLWAMFVRVTLVELALAAAGWLVRFGLPRLAG